MASADIAAISQTDNLIVSDDPPHSRLYCRCSRNMTEPHLRQLFSPFGEIQNLKMLTEHITGVFKGIAFIKFGKASEAARAKEELNGRTLDGQLMFIQFAEASRGSGAKAALEDLDRPPFSRVYVTCPKSFTEEDLHKLFSRFGEVENINILKDRGTQESRGTAFVKYSKASAAAQAVETIMEEMSHAREPFIKCRLAEPRKKRDTGPAGFPMSTTPPAIPSAAMYQAFPVYPQLPVYTPPAPEYPPIPQSFYTRRKQADPRQRADQKRSENNYPPGSRLFISFSKPIQQELLQEIFRRYGPLENVFLLNGKNYGYAKYATAQGAQLAIASLNDRLVEGAACRVSASEPQLAPAERVQVRPKPGETI